MRRFPVAGLAVLLTLSAFASPVLAQARPDSLAMTCAQVRDIVRSRGAAVIGSGPYIFDRFVSDQRFCAITEGTKPAWIPTRDTRQCPVGFTCIPVQDMWPMSDF